MKQFHKAIECICARCISATIVNTETIYDAKKVLANDKGWRNTHDGWVCDECIAREEETNNAQP